MAENIPNRFQQVNRHIEPCSDAAALARRLQAAIKDWNLNEMINIIHSHVLAVPGTTYHDINQFLHTNGYRAYLDIKEARDIPPTHTVMDLQGNIDKQYVVSFQIVPDMMKPSTIKNMQTQTPLDKLANAGYLVERSSFGGSQPRRGGQGAMVNTMSHHSIPDAQVPTISAGPDGTDDSAPGGDGRSRVNAQPAQGHLIAWSQLSVFTPTIVPPPVQGIRNGADVAMPVGFDGAAYAAPRINVHTSQSITRSLQPETARSTSNPSTQARSGPIVPVYQPVVEREVSVADFLRRLDERNSTGIPALPARFNTAAYAAPSANALLSHVPSTRVYRPVAGDRANARHQPAVKYWGGLTLPNAIAENTNLWKVAADRILQRVIISNVDGSFKIRLDNDLWDWFRYTKSIKRIGYASNRIALAASQTPGRKASQQEVMAKIGLLPSEGGFDSDACREISNSLGSIIKYTLWALDLDVMRENNYQFYVPADRYRFMKLLGFAPRENMAVEFDLVNRDTGEKTGVWRGTLDQITAEKGDQGKVPSKMGCHVLLDQLFGYDEADQKIRRLNLDRPAVRACFKDSVTLATYRRAVVLSR